MLARGLWHQPGAARAERAVHAIGRMLAGLGHLCAELATRQCDDGTENPASDGWRVPRRSGRTRPASRAGRRSGPSRCG